MDIFDLSRVVSVAIAVVVVVLALRYFSLWRKWTRSRKMLGYAVTTLMLSNGYAAFEAALDGSPGAGRSLLIAVCMIVGLFAVLTSLRDAKKEQEDTNAL